MSCTSQDTHSRGRGTAGISPDGKYRWQRTRSASTLYDRAGAAVLEAAAISFSADGKWMVCYTENARYDPSAPTEIRLSLQLYSSAAMAAPLWTLDVRECAALRFVSETEFFAAVNGSEWQHLVCTVSAGGEVSTRSLRCPATPYSVVHLEGDVHRYGDELYDGSRVLDSAGRCSDCAHYPITDALKVGGNRIYTYDDECVSRIAIGAERLQWMFLQAPALSVDVLAEYLDTVGVRVTADGVELPTVEGTQYALWGWAPAQPLVLRAKEGHAPSPHIRKGIAELTKSTQDMVEELTQSNQAMVAELAKSNQALAAALRQLLQADHAASNEAKELHDEVQALKHENGLLRQKIAA